MRKALISGITGQDGSYLAEQLLFCGWEVHGIVRRTSNSNLGRIGSDFLDKVHLHDGDITDLGNLTNLFAEIQPEWIFNLAAQSHVGSSFKMPEYTMQVTGIGAMNMMEAMKQACPEAKLYQASSSEMFGSSLDEFQNERTPLRPISPYAIAKTAAHQMAHIYRSEGLFVSCGILFNHESPRRGDNFLTKKVIKAIARKEKIQLGNLNAIRDWGYAPEYTEAMMRILNHKTADDFVIGTGMGYSVQEFVQTAYEMAGLNWLHYVTIESSLYRLIEAGPLVADYSKAKNCLGWTPQTNFRQLIRIMLDAEKRSIH